MPAIVAGETPREALRWLPSLDLSLSLKLDGLGLTMALAAMVGLVPG